MSKKYHMLEGPPLVGRTLSLCVTCLINSLPENVHIEIKLPSQRDMIEKTWEAFF